MTEKGGFGTRYRLGKPLGHGGMSQVVRAYDRARDEDVALKILSGDAQAKVLAGEFRYIASLHHPGIVRVYDFGLADDGRAFFTMEILDEGDLSDVAERASLGSMMRMAREVFRTLDFVHARGIVHGDLKPSNVMVGLTSRREHYPKLLDFGIAWERADQQHGGTVHFMAPELFARSPRRDHRSDLYAMGVVLYEMLTGDLPFDDESMVRLAQHHLSTPPLDPRDLWPRMPGDLAELILRLLEKRPDDRFQHGREVVNAIDAFLAKTQAPPSSRQEAYVVADPDVSIAGEARFVGHRDLLEELVTTAADLDHGQCVVVQGESGAGKTRLLNELRVAVQLRGVDYVNVHLGETVTPAHMLDRLGSVIRAATDHRVDRGTADRDLVTEADRFILEAERLAQATLTLAKQRPLVFGLEGIGGLPEEASKVVRAFAMGLSEGPVMLVATTQDAEAPVALELSGMDGTERLSLRRMSRDACADIVKSRLGEMDGAETIIEHVYRESGGNPGAIGRVVDALVASDAIVLRRDRWVVSGALGGKLPVLSAEVGLRKIAAKLVQGLSPVEREVAQAAANVGKQCDVALLSALVEVDEVREITLALIAAQVLEPVEDDPSQVWTHLAFSQRAVREVLLDATPAVMADAYSRRIVEILERWRDGEGKPIAAATLARHLIVQDRIEEAAEVTFTAIEASPLPSSEAVSLLRTALAATVQEHRGGAKRWCELAMHLAQIDLNEGRSELAIQGFSAVVDKSAESAPTLGAAARRELGDLLMAQSERSGEEVLRKALLEARELAADELVGSAVYTLANRLMLAGRHDEAKTLLAEALAVADDRGDDDLRARSLKLRATLNWFLGRFEEAESDARSAVAEYRRLSDPRGVAVSLGALANTLFTRGRIDEAQKAYEEALTYAHEAGWLTGIGKLESSLAAAAYHVDDWDTACEHLDAAAAILQRTGNTSDRLTALNGMGFVATKRGETIDARRLYDEALGLARQARYRKGEIDALSNLGELSLNIGAFDEAQAYLDEALRLARDIGAVSAEIETQRRMLEVDLARHHSPSDVAARAEALCERAKEASLGAEPLHIRRVAGIAMARAHRPDDARARLEEAEQGFTEAGSRYEAARTVRIISELAVNGLLPGGNDEQALRSACRVFRRLRAQPELDAARRVRDRLGIAPSSASLHATSDLPSPSERMTASAASVPVLDSHEDQPWIEEMGVEEKALEPNEPDEDPSSIRPAGDTAPHSTKRSLGRDEREGLASAPPQMAAPLLIDVSRELSEILDLDELLASVVDAAIRTSNAQRGFVIACDNSGHPTLRVSRGLGGLDLDDDLEMSRSAVGRVMATRRRVEWRKEAPRENVLGESVTLLGLQAIVALPLINRGRLWGVLYLDTRDPESNLTGETLPSLEALAAHAAVAIQNARLFEELGHKNELMAAAVNQLRHPLDALQRCAKVAHQQSQGTANERIIDTVRAHVRRMSVMVTRLLELATAEPSMVRASKVSVQVRDLVDAAVLQLRPLDDLDERPLTLDVPWGLPTLLGDRDQLIQVIATMLATAMRDTPPDGTITLQAFATEPPLPDDDDPFFPPRDLADDAVEVRVTYRSSGEGHGPLDELGLAIAREIVTHHDGTWDTRTEDDDTVMSVVLPSLIADEARAPRSAS